MSRHGDKSFPKWWTDKRTLTQQPIQIEDTPNSCNLSYHDNYTLVYVRLEDIDLTSIRDQFLTNIGGQVHVQCENHRMPLIASMDRANKCACGKKDHFRCSVFNCDVFFM